ncbi:MAG: hypothetical protein RLY35_1231 [Bacteroidota bacterium]|jgi:hypothetical protein
MIRLLLISFLLHFNQWGLANDEIRGLWFDLDETSKKKTFIDLVERQIGNAPSMEAYRAAAVMLKADLASLPNDKLQYFNQGKDLLETCLRKNPWNTECRFIRLTLQCKSPWFLGYHDHIEEDAKVILDHFKLQFVTTKVSYWKKAIQFMVMNSHVPNDIKTQLANIK